MSSGTTVSSEMLVYEVVAADVGKYIKLSITPQCSVQPTDGDTVESSPLLILNGLRAGVVIRYACQGKSVQADKIVWSQLVGSTYIEAIEDVPDEITGNDGIVWFLRDTHDKSILVRDEIENNVIVFNYSNKPPR